MNVDADDLAHALTCALRAWGPCLRCLVLHQAARAAGSEDCTPLTWEGPEPIQPLAPLLDKPEAVQLSALGYREAAFHATLPAFEACGAQVWEWGDPDDGEDPEAVRVTAVCGKHEVHNLHDRWHQDHREGSLWAEWSGDPTDRAPVDAPRLAPLPGTPQPLPFPAREVPAWLTRL